MGYDTAPAAFWAGFAGVIGLILGSFSSVVIHRLPRMIEQASFDVPDEDEATLGRTQPHVDLCVPPSSCPACGSRIPWYFNVPLLGFLCLGGRCARCHRSISLRYPLLELGSAGLSVLLMLRFGPGMEWLWAQLLTTSLLCLSVIDLDHQLLPDDLTLPTLWLGLILSVIGVFVDAESSILGAALGYLFFWSVHHLFRLTTGRQGLGQGDFKLLALLGAWLGWMQIPVVVFLASLVGALLGGGLIALGLRQRSDPIPFGPFLAVAGWLALVFGPLSLPFGDSGIG